MSGIKAVFFHQLGRFAALSEEIVHCHEFHGAGGGTYEHSGNQFSEASGNKMLLGGHHCSCLGGRGYDSCGVQGLDGMYVNDFCGDPLLLQFLGCKEGLPY